MGEGTPPQTVAAQVVALSGNWLKVREANTLRGRRGVNILHNDPILLEGKYPWPKSLGKLEPPGWRE